MATAAKKKRAYTRRAKPNGETPAAQTTSSAQTINVNAKVIPNTFDRPTTEILPVLLTQDEITLYAKESARLHGDKRKLEQQRKDGSAELKAKISALDTRIADLNRKIESGAEERNVPCFWRIDYKKGTKTLFRSDNGKAEEIRSYPLAPDERQQKLPLGEMASDLAAKKTETKGEPPAEEEPDVDNRKVAVWFGGLGKEGREKVLGARATERLVTGDWATLSIDEQQVVRAEWQQRSGKEG